MDPVEVYTDGSWIPGFNSYGYAGIGVYFSAKPWKNVSAPIHTTASTNQLAELLALKLALRYCRFVPSLRVLTDSIYSINCVNLWYESWERNGWTTAKRTPVKYADIIKSIHGMIDNRSVVGYTTELSHVKAHSGIGGNEAADKLAHTAARQLELQALSRVYFFDGGQFSNFYLSIITVAYKGETRTYNCVEQFYQYQKCMHFGDSVTAQEIGVSGAPYIQRSLGKQVLNFSCTEWDSVKEDIMVVGLREKYTQSMDLKQELLATRPKYLAEARPDTEWGIGCKSLMSASRGERWTGKNLLGKCLMVVREELQ